MNQAFITATSSELPNQPVGNDQIEDVLGQINNKPSRTRRIILRNNGIKQRHYVLDPISREPVMNNTQLTAKAVRGLFSNNDVSGIDLLACGTTMPDQIAPGHAVMVHGELSNPVCETVSTSGICISGLMALKYAFLAVMSGDSQKAVATGSEAASIMLRAENFQGEAEVKIAQLESHPEIGFDKDFLRWMLSDGAGAVCIEPKPNPDSSVNLKIHWIKTYSYANKLDVCMYAGALKNEQGQLVGWNRFSTEQLAAQSVLAIKQDVKLLNENIVRLAIVETIKRLQEQVSLKAEDIDYFLPHISSMYFYQKVSEALEQIDFLIPQEKWFTNLVTKGNTGSASIYIMLDELMKSGRLKQGEKILCFVPESGRFSSGYMLLEVM